ncbi:putative quinol monooxygenase [Allobranchiibius sp. CTAmp26]|uniref:putative quinol monooxygenase n=1 Tax=Allobranchiibius sp. CTAmp26 TaxID=2815214 RepID=UPI001AA0DB24|nr:putative quinol monooxygenase [Allobranchiibius sp. CTAmp26]MBO1756948.1 antibiotic biosynthesis monooxygenase [Allobranchiibius sp. CTAmp26]
MAEQSSEVIVVATFTALAGKEEDGARFLSQIVAPSHDNADCLLLALHRDFDNAGRFTFIERWVSRERLEASYETEEFKEFINGSLAYFDGPPAITLNEALPYGEQSKGSLAGASL